MNRWVVMASALALLALAGFPADGFAHAMAVGDKGSLREVSGVLLAPFIYLGAKHMVTCSRSGTPPRS